MSREKQYNLYKENLFRDIKVTPIQMYYTLPTFTDKREIVKRRIWMREWAKRGMIMIPTDIIT